MNKDAVAGLALGVIAAAYWYFADLIPDSALSGHVGADGLPKLLAYVLGGLSLVLFVRGLLVGRMAPAGGNDGERHSADWYAHARAAGLFVMAALYIVAVPYLGYVLSIGILMFAIALYAGARLSLQLVGIAVAGAVLFYILFVRVLNIPLPAGSLFGF